MAYSDCLRERQKHLSENTKKELKKESGEENEQNKYRGADVQ